MARVAITIKTKVGAVDPAVLDLLKSGLTAGDPTNDHSWVLQNGDEVYAVNTHATLGRTVRIQQTANRSGRPVNPGSTYAEIVLAAGEAGFFGPLSADGWQQADGSAYLDLTDGSAGDVKLAVLRR